MSVKQMLMNHPLLDAAILYHGFAPFMRDYEVIAEVMGESAGRYRYCFTHCPEATVVTSIPDETWRTSWDDLYTDYERWSEADAPKGFVWGVRFAVAYPGLIYVESSRSAEEWSKRFDKPMHEIRLETQVFILRLIFHDVKINKLDNNISIINRITIPIENK